MVNLVNIIEHWQQLDAPLCLAQLQPDLATSQFTELHNPLVALAEKTSTGNNVELKAQSSCLLTGQNSAGKTTLLIGIGLNTLLASIGMPVFAQQASIRPVQQLHTHFQIAEQHIDGKGRFEEELTRLQKILNSTNENTLLLLNETFSSTDAVDAVKLAEILFKKINRLGAKVVFATHLHSLYSTLEKDPIFAATLQSYVGLSQKRFAFEQRSPQGSSFALDIAKKYELI